LIVGGTPAATNQFKFAVFIKLNFPDGITHACKVCSCTGYLIAPDLVGTSGLCFDDYYNNNPLIDASMITVTAGVNDYTDMSKGQRIVGKEYARHPNYTKGNASSSSFDPFLLNDFGYIRLASPFTLGDDVGLIGFASALPATGTQVYLAGWGNIQGIPPVTTNDLMFYGFSFTDAETCQAESNKTIAESQICVENTPEHTACNGDGGGPLFTTSNIDSPTDAQIIGSTSYGSGGCAAKKPTVFANLLSSAGSWIQQLVNDLESQPSTSVQVNTFEHRVIKKK